MRKLPCNLDTFKSPFFVAILQTLQMKRRPVVRPGTSILSSVIIMNFTQHSGPPVYAIPPGVFDRTGDDLHHNGAHFGLCFGILGERRPLRARIGEVMKSE